MNKIISFLGMRSKDGINNEIKELQKFIHVEREFIKSGLRPEIWHNPRKRIFDYEKKIKELQTFLQNETN